MSKTWEIHKLGQVAEIIMGTSPPSSSYNTVGDGVPLINGPVEFGGTKPFDKTVQTKFTIAPKRFCKAGDLILCVRGSTTGRMNIAVCDSAIGRGVAAISAGKNQDWVNRYISFQRDTIYKLGSGATFPNVSASILSNLEIPLPPLAEQQRIVSILDEAFAAIDRAKEIAQQNLANARELFESYLNRVFTEKGEGWEERLFGDESLVEIIDGDRGVNYPKKKDFSDAGFCLFMNTKNVRPDGLNFDSSSFITKEKDDALRKGKLQRNDVVITTRGTVGNLGVYSDDIPYRHVRINSGMLILRPNPKELDSWYLFTILRSRYFRSQMQRSITGAAQPQLPIKTLVKLKVAIPVSLTVQQQIVDEAMRISSHSNLLLSTYQNRATALDELKQSILQKAFTGQLTKDMPELENVS